MSDDREHDRRLAERAGGGDERAFDELVERHQKPLLRYVARRFRPELAEDAVQEALLAAHRALIAGTRPADVRAWLSTIAWRRALDIARRERDALPLDAGVAAKVSDDPEARAMQAHELDRVVSAMCELPERQRTALKLSALEGRSLEEIGHALDVGADTAKSLVARSRRTLTHRLAAADMDCGDVRLEMEAAALRGVRLSGTVTLHLDGCRACARAHRAIRRRRRVALLIPFGLIVRTAGIRDKLRDLIAFNPAWEMHATAAKMCTAACLTAVGTGAVAAPTVTVAVPLVVQTATPTPMKAKLAKKKKRAKPRATPTPTATVVVAQATPVWTPTANPTAAAKKKKKADRQQVPEWMRHKKRPQVVMAGSGESGPGVVKPKRTPTPAPTPVATPTPAPPAATPPPPEPTPTPPAPVETPAATATPTG
ncbi:sigma-70 family RNA polymerase sigma factor [Solirubrobacter sp. CPCC 204708]|uniref:Sigma-70 family RNA polymerase sigma factor n=1 Tax=Solirubrobacter deserti TaxID=2282478 RepID=A0ABT4RU25_9ACTN|nr:sigma-70 family RNA polymerase sigma factor [Solirubrobacter deserti]MBE2317269.1 sigma-70 family RNA polymerase sigma factor [Solirubrobacter deserti]MDA0142036.1 sigma-70 family RNA polymerase sigma factor [Solirubrobacter deserti]